MVGTLCLAAAASRRFVDVRHDVCKKARQKYIVKIESDVFDFPLVFVAEKASASMGDRFGACDAGRCVGTGSSFTEGLPDESWRRSSACVALPGHRGDRGWG